MLIEKSFESIWTQNAMRELMFSILNTNFTAHFFFGHLMPNNSHYRKFTTHQIVSEFKNSQEMRSQGVCISIGPINWW